MKWFMEISLSGVDFGSVEAVDKINDEKFGIFRKLLVSTEKTG